jgi:hypothetical protein
MRLSLTDEHKKSLVLAIVGIVFSLGFTVILGKNSATLYRSDLYLRWYAIDKLAVEGRSLYDSRNGAEVTTEVWGEGGSLWTENFYYPAHLMVLIGPLALLPYPTAHLMWTLAGQFFYLLALWLCMRLYGWPDSINKQTVLLVAAVLFIPYLQHTIWSQFNTISVLSLVFCLYALRGHKYGLAGILAVGLTFKPHATVLLLAFLLIWALFKRDRWCFFVGFGLTALALWAITELLQPSWVVGFLSSLGGYGPADSVLDGFWNPYQVPASVLCLVALVFFVRNGRASASSSAFKGCIILGFAIWSLVMPVLGMLHIVMLPVAVVLLLSSLQTDYPWLYRPGLYGLVVLYGLGIAGFAWGLSSPDRYGSHITWAKYAYKVAAPIYFGLLSLPLCLIRKRQPHVG